MTSNETPIPGRVAVALASARGLTRTGFAMGLGVLGALSFEPLRIFPFLLLSYAGLVVMLDGAHREQRPLRAAANIGWSFGFGYFLIGLYWIGYAFLVDPQAHLWQLPFAALAMPGGLALFFAVAAMACMPLWRPGVTRIFVFALMFFTAEWLRGHILTGFPWNLPAYGWGLSLAILQSTSVIGAYGLSLLTLLFGASFAALAPYGRTKNSRFAPASMALVFLVIWGAGEFRLAGAGDDTVEGVHFRIVQPSTPQDEKYRQDLMVRNWRRLIDLSNMPAPVEPTHIIWPEAAPPFALMLVPQAMMEIAAMTDGKRVLLTGDQRVEGGGPQARYFNSFDVVGSHGEMLSTYDKFHLVPFGEYVPLAPVLKAIGWTEIAANTGFSSGPGPRTLEVPGAPPVGPLICYEVIFPGDVTAKPRPAWLVNVTDDSWFGPNTGPMQHLLIARVRAIEEGLPIIRAANSGISAVIDPYGRLRASLALGLRGVIDSDLPVALSQTVFARQGNTLLLVLVLLCASAALWSMVRPQT